MPSITFRGAHIRYADLRHAGEEGGKFVRLHMTADFSKPVREQMGWNEDIPDYANNSKLKGKLIGKHLELVPNGRELKKHALEIDCSVVSAFVLARVKGEDNETERTELRFIVRSEEPGAGAMIESYIEHIGRGDGAMKISHEKQEKLELEASQEEGEEDEQMELGEDEEEDEEGPSLASKRSVEVAENGGKPPARPRPGPHKLGTVN